MTTPIIIGFGRVNIPHPGHYEYISQCDIFVLSEGEAKNKMPVNVRYDNLIYMYPELEGKIAIGNIVSYFKRLSSKGRLIALVTEDNKKFPTAFGVDTKLIERYDGFSSTMVRSIIDNKDWDTLKSIYPSKCQQRLAITIRNQELSKIYC